jgi:uncharacterized protein YciI
MGRSERLERSEDDLVNRGRTLWILALAILTGAAATAPAADPNTTPSEMTMVYMVLLKKGPAWTAEKTPATQAIQDAHLANIRKMWADKKLVIAGPFGDDGDLRGVFLFQVGSLDEAKALTASDPAVQAGRLTPEIHPWWVEKRALPAPGSYCDGTKP